MCLYLPKGLHNQRFRNTKKIELTPDYLYKNGPNPLTTSQTANTSIHRLTIDERRDDEKQQQITRAKEYQHLLDTHKLTKAQLARQLGMSRAWVTKVLKGP